MIRAIAEPEQLTFQEETERAFAKILRCANAKEQSSVKMAEKLARAGHSPEAVHAALSRAMDAHIIDDVRYAEMLIRSALAQGKGLRFVLKEVESLGVEAEGLDAYRSYVEEQGSWDSQVERALSVLGRKRCTAKNVQASCYRRLMAKGYGPEVASEAARLFAERTEGDASAQLP